MWERTAAGRIPPYMKNSLRRLRRKSNREKFRPGIRLHALVNLKVAMSSSPFGMNNPFRDTFPIEVGHFLNKLYIL